MNVATLLNNGYKISHVAGLTTDELNKLVDELHVHETEATVYAAYVHDLMEAMVTFDEQKVDVVINRTKEQFGFEKAVINIFYPFLQRTGILWRTNQAMPVEEHFASNIIRRKIIAAIDSLPAPTKNNNFLLFLPPAEWHELGLLFANYLIKAAGIRTVYLGQNVPIDEVNLVAARAGCDHLLLFYITPRTREQIREELHTLAKDGRWTVLFTGSGEVLSDLGSLPANCTYLPNADALLNKIKVL